MSGVAGAGAGAGAGGAPRETKHAMKLRHKAELKALLSGGGGGGIGAKKKLKEEEKAMVERHEREVKEWERGQEQAQEQAQEQGASSSPSTASSSSDTAASSSDANSQSQPQTAQPGTTTETTRATPAYITATTTNNNNNKPSRAQQRRAKQAQKEKQRIADVAEEVKDMRDPKAEEMDAFMRQLAPHRLCIHQVASDGHCLFRAIGDQLERAPSAHATSTIGKYASQNKSTPAQAVYMTLREVAAAHMRSHLDDFIPFLTDDEGMPLTEEAARAYIESIASASSSSSSSSSEARVVWGGHTEIVALSAALQRKIVVYHGEGKEIEIDQTQPSSSSSSVSSQEAEAPLRISFHRHYYGLGDHYNSIVTMPAADDEEDEAEGGVPEAAR